MHIDVNTGRIDVGVIQYDSMNVRSTVRLLSDIIIPTIDVNEESVFEVIIRLIGRT